MNTTPTLADLIKRDDVRASWFYTHSENASIDSRYNPDVYDVVFSRNDGVCLYGGRMNRRHVLIDGIHQTPALSQPNQGGRLIKPDAVQTLGDLLGDAAEADNYDTFAEWFDGQGNISNTPAPQLLAEYEQIMKVRDALRAWLGDDFTEYVYATTS